MVQTLARDLRPVTLAGMNDPRLVPFGEIAWTEAAPGIRARERTWAGPGGRWSSTGRGPRARIGARRATAGRGGGRDRVPLRRRPRAPAAGKGEAFMLPPAPLGGGAHSGRNPSQRPTRLFLIDDAPGDTPKERRELRGKASLSSAGPSLRPSRLVT